ncbi:MAG TPA: hypothetical protein PKX93_12545, partial [bacterium]|nr:hypothetical protein [bacterium]
DPVIAGEGLYKDDPFWCGRPHLSCHVITALTCLGEKARQPLLFLKPWYQKEFILSWLNSRNWAEGVANTGNEIMNLGTLLQYSRDFHGDRQAGRAANLLLDWLSSHYLQEETGTWGRIDTSHPFWRSQAVQAAYHLWSLFFYDGRPIPFLERAIDTVLATQNPLGGFGWGVHNREKPFHSSACEDIDSIDPLCRMLAITDYRRQEMIAALLKAEKWVLSNQVRDGGFVFIKDQVFTYGHSQLTSGPGEGAMFPTWFRLLSLSFIGTSVPGSLASQVGWHFLNCPGMQFSPKGPTRDRQISASSVAETFHSERNNQEVTESVKKGSVKKGIKEE